MYLKNIEIHGFKSFANKINFQFHNGITGIVGPNGSGKSNVADAVRWVLGEQKTKQLRSSKMEDVIFAGTENRKPMGYAYVAITFDNADHKLNIDYDEVTVMKNYLLEHGIPEEDIITDNYGISTYDSIYRVKNVYKSNKVVIVSQRYHLYRALFLSDNLDLESYGVEANLRYYYGQWYREIREILARNKDFIKGIIKPKAVYTAFNYN